VAPGPPNRERRALKGAPFDGRLATFGSAPGPAAGARPRSWAEPFGSRHGAGRRDACRCWPRRCRSRSCRLPPCAGRQAADAGLAGMRSGQAIWARDRAAEAFANRFAEAFVLLNFSSPHLLMVTLLTDRARIKISDASKHGAANVAGSTARVGGEREACRGPTVRSRFDRHDHPAMYLRQLPAHRRDRAGV